MSVIVDSFFLYLIMEQNCWRFRHDVSIFYCSIVGGLILYIEMFYIDVCFAL